MSLPTLPKPEAIIFDWDDTLVRSDHTIFRIFKETLEEFDVTVSEENLHKYGHLSAKDSFPIYFGPKLWPKAYEFFKNRFDAVHLDEVKPLEGAEELLKHLTELGLALFIVSNKRGPTLRKEVAHFGWDPYFGKIVGAGDAAQDKPQRDVVDLVLKGSEIVPSPHVWFVGDTFIDWSCGKNVGLTSLAIFKNPLNIQGFSDVPFVADYHQLKKMLS